MIMRRGARLVVVSGLFMLGCGETDQGAVDTPASPAPTAVVSSRAGPGIGPAPTAAPTAAGAAVDVLTPVPVASGKVALTPENTSIGFVGTHVGARPDPRVGGFERFTGTAEVDPASKALKSASVEIQTDSLWTQLPPLTTHLKSPDFFDAREHPIARFQTKSVVANDKQPGNCTITGDLTVLAKTKEVSFPAKVDVSDSGLTMSGSFSVDRTELGMDRVQDRVQKEVTITVAIGKKTAPLPATGGPGGPGGRGGRRGAGPGGPGGPGGSPGQPRGKAAPAN